MSSCPLTITTGIPASRWASRSNAPSSMNSGVAPVVRDEAGEAEAEARVVVAGIRLVTGHRGDVRVLPCTPSCGGRFVDRRVWALQQSGVGGGQISVALVVRKGVAEPLPLLREHPAHRPGHPIHVGM